MTKAEEIMSAIINYRNHWTGGKGLEYIKDTQSPHIKYNNVVVGFIEENYDYSDFTFLVLTLQEFLLPSRVRLALTKAANENETKVVFAPILDIGFGEPEPQYLSLKQQYKILKKVAKHSCEDIKTAAVVSVTDHATQPTLRAAQYYTYNQKLQGFSNVFHAEATLAEFLNVIEVPEDQREDWLVDLEPCVDCLRDMIDYGARTITYITPHKEKWNTSEYYNLLDDIQNKTILNVSGYPILYRKESI